MDKKELKRIIKEKKNYDKWFNKLPQKRVIKLKDLDIDMDNIDLDEDTIEFGEAIEDYLREQYGNDLHTPDNWNVKKKVVVVEDIEWIESCGIELPVSDDIASKIKTPKDLNDFYAYCESNRGGMYFTYLFSEKHNERIDKLLADINYVCGVYDDKNVNRILGDEYNDFEIATA